MFAVAVVAALALGVGAAATTFTLLNAIILRPLPYPESDRLVALRHAAPRLGVGAAGQSATSYLHYREHNRTFEDIGAYIENVVSITEDGDPERVRVALVTPGVFSILRVVPHLGVPFTAAHAAADGPAPVMISHGLWQRRYGGDPAVIGRTIELNRTQREIIGVLPPGFDFPDPRTQVWYVLAVEPEGAGLGEPYLSAIGRLRRGATPEAAALDLQQLLGGIPGIPPDLLRAGGWRPTVEPLRAALIEDVRKPLVILLFTALLVLVLACANATNLVLVRAGRYSHEVAVERALGASGRDLASRFLTENVLLAGAAGVAGAGLVYAAVRSGPVLFEPGSIPRLHEVDLDGAAIAFTVGLTLLLGGVLPSRPPGTADSGRPRDGRLVQD